MDRQTVKETLSRIFGALQNLDIKPSVHNVNILAGCLNDLQTAFAELDKPEATKGDDADA